MDWRYQSELFHISLVHIQDFQNDAVHLREKWRAVLRENLYWYHFLKALKQRKFLCRV